MTKFGRDIHADLIYGQTRYDVASYFRLAFNEVRGKNGRKCRIQRRCVEIPQISLSEDHEIVHTYRGQLAFLCLPNTKKHSGIFNNWRDSRKTKIVPQLSEDKERDGWNTSRSFWTAQRQRIQWTSNQPATTCRSSVLCLRTKKIQKAIVQLKNCKVARPDDIPAEALKVDIDTSVEMLYPLFMKIWEKKRGANGMEYGITHRASKREISVMFRRYYFKQTSEENTAKHLTNYGWY